MLYYVGAMVVLCGCDGCTMWVRWLYSTTDWFVLYAIYGCTMWMTMLYYIIYVCLLAGGCCIILMSFCIYVFRLLFGKNPTDPTQETRKIQVGLFFSFVLSYLVLHILKKPD